MRLIVSCTATKLKNCTQNGHIAPTGFREQY